MTTEVQAPLAIPESTEIKTGAYVIPSNKYARVKCLEAHDQDFLVNGVICEKARRYRESRQSAVYVGNQTFTFPSGYTYRINLDAHAQAAGYRVSLGHTSHTPNHTNFVARTNSDSGATNSVSNTTEGTSPWYSAHKEYILQGGDSIRFNQNWSAWYVSGYLIKQGDNYEDIVPAGTLLDGDRYSVSLYPIPLNNLPSELQE